MSAAPKLPDGIASIPEALAFWAEAMPDAPAIIPTRDDPAVGTLRLAAAAALSGESAQPLLDGRTVAAYLARQRAAGGACDALRGLGAGFKVNRCLT